MTAQGRAKLDVIAGIHEAIGRRIHSLANHVGVISPVLMSGGVAKNVGMVHVLGKLLETDIIVTCPPKISPVLMLDWKISSHF